jgi:hypothetical protein
MLAHVWSAIGGPFLWGGGRPALELRVQAAVSTVLVLALLLASGGSLVVLAWTVCGVYWIRAIWTTSVTARSMGLGLAVPGTVFVRGLAAGLGIGGVLLGLDLLLRSLAVLPPVRLLLEGVVGALALLVLMRVGAAWLVHAVASDGLRRLAKHLPPRLQGVLQAILPMFSNPRSKAG